MGLFDIFTGAPAKRAAEQQRQYLSGVLGQNTGMLNEARTGGLAALQGGQTGALDALRGGFGQARTDIQGGLPPALDALYRGRNAGVEALTGSQTGALNELRGGVQAAAGAYDPLLQAGGRYGKLGGDAGTMLSNALGLGGQAGIDAARGAFKAGSGYEFALNQGLEAANRNAAAGGNVGGNALVELQNRGQGLANQEYGNYLKNLQGVAGLYSPLESQALGAAGAGQGQAFLTGATGGANIMTGTGQRLADLQAGTGARAAGLYGDQAKNLADLSTRLGGGEADILRGGGAAQANLLAQLAGIQTQGASQLAVPYAGTYGTEAAAQMQGSRNLFDVLGGVGNFFTSPGFGNLGKNIASTGTAVKGLFG